MLAILAASIIFPVAQLSCYLNIATRQHDGGVKGVPYSVLKMVQLYIVTSQEMEGHGMKGYIT